MKPIPFILSAVAAAAFASVAQADAVTDWNLKSGEFITEAKMGTPPAVRVMALVQTAALQALESAQQRQASPEAALAAAHRVTLTKLLPAQQASIDGAAQAALAAVAEGPAKQAGIAAGEAAANAVLAARRRRRHHARVAPPADHARRLRADGDAGGAAVATAQAVADGQRCAVPPGAAGGARQRAMGA